MKIIGTLYAIGVLCQEKCDWVLLVSGTSPAPIGSTLCADLAKLIYIALAFGCLPR
jgi:hypothetical protein